MTEINSYDPSVLPAGIRSRFVDGVNGLRMHVLEAGYDVENRPCLLLLHGFPELAYSWRRVMPALAAAGYHVVAPDQRGYGRTTGWDGAYDGDLRSFRQMNLVTDMLALAAALGRRAVDAVIGHDFGAHVAAHAALIRPDVFRAMVLMSAPYAGPPPLTPKPQPDVHAALAALARPRKHYQWYYSTRNANGDMWRCPQGVHDFLRAYYHHKSADWAGNRPFPLRGWTAEELAKMPTYYIMDRDRNMAETVAPEMPSPAQIAACAWLPEEELRVYSGEYERTGFQGGLQWYRCGTSPAIAAELRLFAGRTVDVPSLFIGGKSDWGAQQRPGAIEAMQAFACTDMRGCHLIEGAGHWVQQEQPEAVTRRLLEFLAPL
ncbi:MAG: alpha/beta hydrolase [Alphaproteobacteria bacterium]